MEPWRRAMKSAGFAIFLLALNGCASTELGRAKTLATAGVSASSSMATAQAAVASSFADDRRAEDMQDAFMGARPSPPSPVFEQVADKLAARRAVAERLKETYASFQALATYDASGEFQASAAQLFDAVNASGVLAGIPAPVGRAVGALGGGLLSRDQVRRLKRASGALRAALTQYETILEHDGPGFVSVQRSAIRSHYAAVRLLWNAGFLTSNALISSLAPEDGLALVGEPKLYTRDNPRVDALVRFELTRRDREQEEAVGRAEEQQLHIVKDLIARHEAFEHGAPLTFEELQAAAAELAATVDLIAHGKKEAK